MTQEWGQQVMVERDTDQPLVEVPPEVRNVLRTMHAHSVAAGTPIDPLPEFRVGPVVRAYHYDDLGHPIAWREGVWIHHYAWYKQA